MSWSGGKDSSLALHAALQDPSLHVEGLLTTVTEGYERISMHGVRLALLERQADAIGLPLHIARIPQRSTNDEYERATRAALAPLRANGVTHVIAGDLFLADVREYRERLVASAGMETVFPLWERDTTQLAHAFVAQGFEAILCCVDPKQIDASCAGCTYDHALLAQLPASADPCGERGEFHTFVYNGPIFRDPVAIERGEVVCRDGFWFCDIL